MYNDPTGHWPHLGLLEVAKSVSNWVENNQDKIAKAAITVATVAGTAAVCAATAGVGCVVGAGAIAAASSYSRQVVDNVWEESGNTTLFDGSNYNSDTMWNDVDKSQVITDGVIGALGTGVGLQASNLSNSLMRSVCNGGNCRYAIAAGTGFAEGAGVQALANIIDGDPETEIGDGVLGAGLEGAMFSVIGHGASRGDEISFGDDFRAAPFGNRTGHVYGERPHYHRLIIDPATGETAPGGSMKWHRPYEQGW